MAQALSDGRLTMQILVSIFRNRGGHGSDLPGGERPTAIDRCDIAIDDGVNTESRFIVKITFRNGVFLAQRVLYTEEG